LSLLGPNSLNIHLSLGGGTMAAGPSLLIVGATLLGCGLLAQLALRGARRAGEEEGLRHAAQEESTRLRLVLRGISHEIANGLQPIYNGADAVRTGEKDAEGIASNLETSARRIRRLTGDLNDAARSFEGELRLIKSPCNVTQVASELVDEFDATARDRDLKLVVDGADATINADRDRVEQSVANLLQNAIRYTPSGGAISVTVTQRDSEVVIQVKDTGLGLTPAQLGGLFQPFARFHENAAAGAGLGLWVTKNIMSAHGGSALAESLGPGRGATFSLHFPNA
jgi:signal transduction histidine kinase